VTRSIGGELIARIAQHWAAFAEISPADLQELRNAVEELHGQFEPPPHVVVRPVNAGGVAGLLLTPKPEQDASLLYLHGGMYVTSSAFGYRHLAACLADEAGTGVLVPDYRLAPEFPYPAAVEDAVRAYRWMLDRGASQVTVAGDSSGCGLVLSFLLSCKQQGIPMPSGAILLCPWNDLRPAGHDQPSDEFEGFRRMGVDLYLAGQVVGSSLTVDLTGLPPMLIQVGDGDPLMPEARALAEHAAECGVATQFELFPVDTHDFHIFWSFLPEAVQAIQQAGRFAHDVRHRQESSDKVSEVS
jgi:epsilon-lactone hydrolase